MKHKCRGDKDLMKHKCTKSKYEDLYSLQVYNINQSSCSSNEYNDDDDYYYYL